MARGRTARTTGEVVDVPMNEEALASASHALTELNQEALAIKAQFGLEDVTPGTLVREIRVWIDHSARAMFEVGIRLCALRAICPKGEWLPVLEREIGMSARTAQRFMAAAIRCVGENGQREQLLKLSRSKVMELVALDDEQLEELDSTGRITQLALELDEIDRMSVTELRQALRERDQVVAAKDKLLVKKDSKINQLSEQLERPFTPDADTAARTAEEQALLDALAETVRAAEAAFLQLFVVLPQVLSQGNEALAEHARADVEYLAQRVADVCNDNGVDVGFEERVKPSWLKKAGKGRKA